jgi:hypothetical protein
MTVERRGIAMAIYKLGEHVRLELIFACSANTVHQKIFAEQKIH